MVVFKRCFLAFVVLVVSAGPTVAVHATGHHHASHARIAHNQRNKSLSRLSESSQEPGDSETTTAPTGNSQDQPTLNEPLSTPETETEGLTLSTFSSSRAVSTTEAGLALLIPNGIKAGVAGGDAYNILRDHIGWWYDWTPSPSKPGKPIGVPMLWGDGHADSTDAKRLKQFERLSSSSSGRMGHPKYVLGYEEPDCGVGSGSSGIGVEGGVREWERLIGPLKKRGTKVGSPSMCKQADETWLKEFAKRIETPWDFTAIHVNKNNIDGVKKDIDHYWKTYGKPIWVTEFACVNDHNTFTPCTNQQQINSFIHQVVEYFEQDSRVYAYAYSNGEGLGDVWPMMRDGRFSKSGEAYLKAIKRYH